MTNFTLNDYLAEVEAQATKVTRTGIALYPSELMTVNRLATECNTSKSKVIRAAIKLMASQFSNVAS